VLMRYEKPSEYTERFRQLMPGLVDDLLSREWSASAATNCSCGAGLAALRCDDCFASSCLCETCMSASHSRAPFHRIRRWNGQFFQHEPATAEIWLGHEGRPCQTPLATHKIDIAHITGIFAVQVHPCGCDAAGAGDEWLLPRQLMRQGLFPGSLDQFQVHWAFTFKYLDQWLAVSHHAKISVMDYWSTTWYLSSGLPAERVRYLLQGG